MSDLPLARALLSPRSIALFGQSGDETKTAGRPLKYLRQAGYAGKIYPINPRRDTVLGEQAWRTLDALPERPDHAFILSPTDSALDAVEECGRLGIPVVTVLAAGFSEAGPEGKSREGRLREICARWPIRVVGPSSLGIVNLREHVLITANAAFAEPELPVGRTFVASQSGSLIGALMSRGKGRGIGFAGLVSVGNEVDLGVGEICAATLDDPDIDSYLLFLETARKADALRAFAVAAAERGKPVVAYKLGRSSEARDLAVGHTGALAGEDDVADAFFAACGIARVDDFEALLESPALLRRLPAPVRPKRPPTVGVVTTTGGGAAMVVDQLAVRGIHVEGPSPETLKRLAEAARPVEPGRIADLTLAGVRYDVMKPALDVMLSAPEFDLVIAVVGSSARFHPELAVKPIIDSVGAKIPLAAFLVPDAPDALLQLMQAGVPAFRTPEGCADAIAAGLKRRPAQPFVPGRHVLPPKGGRMLNELDAYGLLGRLGVPHAPAVAVDVAAADPPALPFAYPVAVKLLSDAVAHKTDVGGVALGVADAGALKDAIRTMREAVARRAPGTAVERVLVQPMTAGIGEVLVGYRVDPEIGPVVVLAAGGIMTEIYHDRALRLAPVDLDGARGMIAEVKALKALAGYRGRPAGDLEALASAIVALSKLAESGEGVAEAEVNPLIVRRVGEGVVAVDALVRYA